ncbi:hypothetical protein T03_15797 [Trichinella britovi]|uniref:Uncharacterized protein n=1 Tax=Trichinella britovi TaxID=45882 RepID=A0A0V1D2K7_TRIBR|nr:hypothetical protein T03_15797 [Trichinella britovi]
MDYIINIEKIYVHTPALHLHCGVAYHMLRITLVLQIFSESNYIRNHVDKYVITKHYHQLMPLSLATYCFLDLSVNLRQRQGSYGVKPQALPSGYARGQIKICIFPQAIPQAIYSTIFDLRGFLCKFLIASGPRRRLRLCPRANKNLHIPAGYAQSILLHNI